jgi:hypothetical protein
VRPLVALLTLLSCGTQLQTVEVEGCCYSQAEVQAYLDLAQQHWRFDWPMHQPTRITVDEGLRMMGLTRHPDWVLIRPRTADGKRLALNGTALLHEVVHASLWLAEQDPDNDHSLHDWQAVEDWNDEVASLPDYTTKHAH